jgi:hypothetical protein
MMLVLICLATSALLGLATGFVFRVWANLVVAPLVAFGSATALFNDGFGLIEGAFATIACLFASQAAYLLGAFLVDPGPAVEPFLAEDVFDNEPGETRESDITDNQQEKRYEHPSRSLPPET